MGWAVRGLRLTIGWPCAEYGLVWPYDFLGLDWQFPGNCVFKHGLFWP
jgi:hypothetical protein